MARYPVVDPGVSARRRNSIITRGMGPRQQVVTQGYGGFFSALRDAAVRMITLGQSGAKRAAHELEEVVVWIKLLRVNGDRASKLISGSTRVKIAAARRIAVGLAEGTRIRARTAQETFKISVKRVR